MGDESEIRDRRDRMRALQCPFCLTTGEMEDPVDRLQQHSKCGDCGRIGTLVVDGNGKLVVR